MLTLYFDDYIAMHWQNNEEMYNLFIAFLFKHLEVKCNTSMESSAQALPISTQKK